MAGVDADLTQAKTAPSPDKMKVFISYSRADTAFAHEVVAALEYDNSFTAIIDEHDVREGEEWRDRLRDLIVAADTIVFVLSPASAASEVCRWEVAEAQKLSKRILPVLARPLGQQPPPETLAALNYVRFDPEVDGRPRSFMASMTALRRALLTDLDWLQEHTRLLERADEWQRAGRVANRLLVGADISAAKVWLDRRPKNAPEPIELHRDYIAASAAAEAERLSVERQRAERLQRAVRLTRGALAGVLLLACAAAGAAAFAFQKQAETEQARAELSAKIAAFETAVNEIRSGAARVYESTLEAHGIDPRLPRTPAVIASLTDDQLLFRLGEQWFGKIAEFEISLALGDVNWRPTGASNLSYYNPQPHIVGDRGGLVIGLGYDLGQVSVGEFTAIWGELLPSAAIGSLTKFVGRKDLTRRDLGGMEISIPYEAAITVLRREIAGYARLTNTAFPNSAELPPDCFGPLVSLVYNRGASLSGERRQEMLAISRFVELGELSLVPEQIRTMKWLWKGNIEMLVRRREQEAEAFEGCVADRNRSAPVVSVGGPR